MQPLRGKTVILTGASQGLGAVIARALAAAGAQLALAARSQEKLDAVARELEQQGSRVLSVPCDVTREPDRDALIGRTLDAFGRIDVLVNNAGVEEQVFLKCRAAHAGEAAGGMANAGPAANAAAAKTAKAKIPICDARFITAALSTIFVLFFAQTLEIRGDILHLLLGQ